MSNKQNSLTERSRSVPKLRFPEFSGRGNENKLGNIFSIFNGYAFSSSKATNSGVLWVKIADVGIGKMKKDNVSYLPLEFGEKHDKFLLKKGDYVVALTRPILSGKLKIAQIDDFFNNSLLNQRVGKIESQNNKSFVYNLLQKDKLIKSIENNIAGSDPPNLSPSEINGIKNHIPQLPEQQKIASFLTAVDTKLELLQKKKQGLEQYKKGVMQQIFSQQIRFKDTNGKDYPDWEKKKLGEIGVFQTSSVDKLLKEAEKEVYLVNYMNVYKHESINNETKQKLSVVTAKDSQIISSNLLKGDILFTPSSETPTDIGHSVVIFEDLENTVYSYHLLRFRPKVKFNILFSHYFCNTSIVLRQLSKYATGSTRFTISVGNFSKVEVDMPCLEEQIQISNFLSAIDIKTALVNTQLENTQHFKKGLLQQMFV